MKKITITAVFNQWWQGYVNFILTSYKEWEPIGNSSRDYNLDRDDYTIIYNTVTVDT